MYFWCLLIKSSYFTFHEDAALLQKTACLDESVAGFPENIGISAPNLSGGWVQFVFGCQFIRVNHFAFDENTIFRPDTTCRYKWLAGFPENEAISAPNYNWD